MREPCNNCPFRRETKFFLTEERCKTILHAITHDSHFNCHKTVDYSGDKISDKNAQICFGSVLYLENTVSGGCFSNVMYRLGLKIQGVKLEDIRKSELVYDNPEDFIRENSIIV
jgi:hypothetical protein